MWNYTSNWWLVELYSYSFCHIHSAFMQYILKDKKGVLLEISILSTYKWIKWVILLALYASYHVFMRCLLAPYVKHNPIIYKRYYNNKRSQRLLIYSFQKVDHVILFDTYTIIYFIATWPESHNYVDGTFNVVH